LVGQRLLIAVVHSTHVFWSHKETSEIPLSSSTPGWQGCTPYIVEIRSLCLRRRRNFLSLPRAATA